MCNILKINSMNYKEIIEKIIKDTFNVIKEVYEYQKESNKESNAVQSPQKIGSRIIFPKNGDDNNETDRKNGDDNNKTDRKNGDDNNKTDRKNGDDNNKTYRISEQELRFIFVEQFNKSEEVKENQLFYSVETPTKSFYYFSGEEGPKCIPDSEHNEHKGEEGAGRSGNIDLVIFQRNGKNVNRVALIEFKAHNPGKNDYRKDICKLINENEENNDCLKYFIQIINVKNQKKTMENIIDKIKDIDSLKEKDKNIDYCINYRCLNLHSKVENNDIIGEIKGGKLEI